MELAYNNDVVLEHLAEIQWKVIEIREAIGAGDSLLNSIAHTIKSLIDTKSIEDKHWIGEHLSEIPKEINYDFQGAYEIQQVNIESLDIASYRLNYRLRRFSRELYKVNLYLKYDINDLQQGYENYLIEGYNLGDERLLKNLCHIYWSVCSLIKLLNKKIEELIQEEIEIRLFHGISKIWTINEENIIV